MNNNNYININEIKKGQTGHGLLIENDGFLAGNDDFVKQINEDIDSHKQFVIPDHFVVSAIFQKYGVKNANGRIYPEDILKPEVEKYITEKIHGYGNCAIGALDHPAASTLSLHDVTHKIIELHWEDRTLVGKLELHLSPGYRRYGIASTTGDLAANLILDNILIGVSSRGLGDVEQRLGVLTVTDYQLIGWDIVGEPSTPNAFISRDGDSLRQFYEETEVDNNKEKLNEKINRINKLLL